MSLPIMVALEFGEPLMLYIVAMADVVSMVLVVERPKQKQPQALKGAPVARSGPRTRTLQKCHMIKRLLGPTS
jgi:hypothetical protein